MRDIRNLSRDEKINILIEEVYVKNSMNTIYNTIFPSNEIDMNKIVSIICDIVDYVNYILDVNETYIVSSINTDTNIKKICEDGYKFICFYNIVKYNDIYNLRAKFDDDLDRIKIRDRDTKIESIIKKSTY